jgi:ribokinase
MFIRVFQTRPTTRKIISASAPALFTTLLVRTWVILLYLKFEQEKIYEMKDRWITVLGSYVADLTFRIDSLPSWGETRMGASFALGPGGKGSNQAVAAARAGGNVSFISKVGEDPFGEMARKMYREEEINVDYLYSSAELTGAAAILVDAAKGENAIVVVPGACFGLTPEEVSRAEERIAISSVFVAQLELPISVVEHGLLLARKHRVRTVLNPAPAMVLSDSILANCDYLTPNETEIASLTGIAVQNIADASRAASALLARGVKYVIVTLGQQGALICGDGITEHVPAADAGPVLETTGAGDAFNGGFAVALSEGMDVVEATRFGCAVAGISVTRAGTAPSMPRRSEVDALLGSRGRQGERISK